MAADAVRPLSDADRRWLLDASMLVAYRLEAARLGELRAVDPAVRAHATMLRQFYRGAGDELRRLAASRGAAWQTEPPLERRAALDAIGSLAPEFFDRRFVEQVCVTEQRAEIAALAAAARSMIDPALRAWAERSVQALRAHLSAAEQLPVRMQAVG